MRSRANVGLFESPYEKNGEEIYWAYHVFAIVSHEVTLVEFEYLDDVKGCDGGVVSKCWRGCGP